MSDKYLIWSNEHRCWWRANSQGYTKRVEAAGRYDRAEAIAICKGAHDGWFKGEVPPEVPIREMDAIECAPHLFTETAN